MKCIEMLYWEIWESPTQKQESIFKLLHEASGTEQSMVQKGGYAYTYLM